MSSYIPDLILEDENLKSEHKLILGVLYLEKEIHLSDSQILYKLGLPLQKILVIINFLARQDYIEIFIDENNEKKIRFTELKMLLINHFMNRMAIPNGQFAMH